MSPERLSKTRLRRLGFLPLAFFFLQAIHYWQINELGNILWMCNIGNLILALGLLLEKPLLVRVAVVWMVPGLIVWCIYVVPTWGTLLAGRFTWGELFAVFASTMAHFGGITIGLVALNKVRMAVNVWSYVFGWYLIMQLVSRLLSPRSMNVNLAHRVQDGFENSFSVYWKFWLVLTILVAIGAWLIVFGFHRVWPATRSTK
jgi:hypothetical protein